MADKIACGGFKVIPPLYVENNNLRLSQIEKVQIKNFPSDGGGTHTEQFIFGVKDFNDLRQKYPLGFSAVLYTFRVVDDKVIPEASSLMAIGTDGWNSTTGVYNGLTFQIKEDTQFLTYNEDRYDYKESYDLADITSGKKWWKGGK